MYKTIDEIKNEYHKNDVCMVSLLVYMLEEEDLQITDEEIEELLNWAGEDDVTPAEVRAGGVD